MEIVTKQTDRQRTNQEYWDALSKIDSLTSECTGLRIQLEEAEKRNALQLERILIDAKDHCDLIDAVEDLEYLLKKERKESQRLRQLCRQGMIEYE